jgi:hypothetical protein
LTIVETRAITGGVDTNADMHVAAALDPIGGLLGVQEFPATVAGYTRLLDWMGGFGTIALAATARAWPGVWPWPASASRENSAHHAEVAGLCSVTRPDVRLDGCTESAICADCN